MARHWASTSKLLRQQCAVSHFISVFLSVNDQTHILCQNNLMVIVVVDDDDDDEDDVPYVEDEVHRRMSRWWSVVIW